MTTYDPISENLIATEPGNGGEANRFLKEARTSVSNFDLTVE